MALQQTDIIDTTGTTIEDIPKPERPAYTIAAAIEWAQRPENGPKIERFAQEASRIQNAAIAQADETITKIKNLIVDIATKDDVKEDFINSFVGSLIGDE